jgi:hypothetical protein
VSRYKSREAVAAKIQWEGGMEEALLYGIRASDMPDAMLRAAWTRMEDAFNDYRRFAEQVEALLPDAADNGF